MSRLKNILTNMLKPGYFPVMVNKVIKRLREPNPEVIKAKATAWYAGKAVDTFEFIKGIDPVLSKEAIAYNEELQRHGKAVISSLPVRMGGGGNCVLLYFLARYLKPRAIVETGVSMGFSSHAFLSAIKRNDGGHLYSSDFPYFRLPEPEKYIGCVVEESLKANWSLFIEGDHKNLPAIASQVPVIDLFHYDSDKSYAGRKEALRILADKLGDKATIAFDDIGDNFHFRDLVSAPGVKYVILANPNGGYVGLIAPFLKGAVS